MALCLLAPIAACSVHRAGHERPVEPPSSFEASGSAKVPDRWWRAFDDERLAALERRALEGNFELAAARDRLRAARAVVEREGARVGPILDLSVGAERRGRSENDFSGLEEISGELAAEYELDLWDRIGSATDQARFERDATRADLRAAAITLSANVATTWYELVRQRGQRRLVRKQIETNETTLKLVRRRFANGLVRASDVLRQERLLESTREQLERVRSAIDVRKHQLLVLTGRPPTTDLEAQRVELPDLPPKPETGLPSELVQRRPDVRAAFLRVRAADRGIAEAVADRYPQITLSATASVSDEDATDIFDDWARSIAADLVTPLIDAGRRKAEVERNRSVKAERVDAYGQTILTAFQEVADALSREQYQRDRIARIEKQLSLADETVSRLQREYLNGDISYIDVLDALTREQRLQRDLLDARFELIEIRIGLYRALAGGWAGIAPARKGESANGEKGERASSGDREAGNPGSPEAESGSPKAEDGERSSEPATGSRNRRGADPRHADDTHVDDRPLARRTPVTDWAAPSSLQNPERRNQPRETSNP